MGLASHVMGAIQALPSSDRRKEMLKEEPKLCLATLFHRGKKWQLKRNRHSGKP